MVVGGFPFVLIIFICSSSQFWIFLSSSTQPFLSVFRSPLKILGFSEQESNLNQVSHHCQSLFYTCYFHHPLKDCQFPKYVLVYKNSQNNYVYINYTSCHLSKYWSTDWLYWSICRHDQKYRFLGSTPEFLI